MLPAAQHRQGSLPLGGRQGCRQLHRWAAAVARAGVSRRVFMDRMHSLEFEHFSTVGLLPRVFLALQLEGGTECGHCYFLHTQWYFTSTRG